MKLPAHWPPHMAAMVFSGTPGPPGHGCWVLLKVQQSTSVMPRSEMFHQRMQRNTAFHLSSVKLVSLQLVLIQIDAPTLNWSSTFHFRLANFFARFFCFGDHLSLPFNWILIKFAVVRPVYTTGLDSEVQSHTPQGRSAETVGTERALYFSTLLLLRFFNENQGRWC